MVLSVLLLLFDYHLKQHDSQTAASIMVSTQSFDYHLKQHDSQTIFDTISVAFAFDYHLKQHDSQTSYHLIRPPALFDYHLKQHDSQTSNESVRHDIALCCFRWFSLDQFYFTGFLPGNQPLIRSHRDL